jgi:hypothetical protein
MVDVDVIEASQLINDLLKSMHSSTKCIIGTAVFAVIMKISVNCSCIQIVANVTNGGVNCTIRKNLAPIGKIRYFLVNGFIGKDDNLTCNFSSQAILHLASFLKLSSLSLLSFSGSAIKQFESEAKRKGFNVRASQELRRAEREPEEAAARGDLSEQLDSFMRRHLNKDLRPAIVLIASAEDVLAVAESLGRHGERLKKAQAPPPTWIVSSFGLDAKKSPLLQAAFDGALYVEPYLPEMAEFKRHFMRSLQVRACEHDIDIHLAPPMMKSSTPASASPIFLLQSTDSAMHDLLEEFKVELFGCASSAESSRSASSGRFLVPCDKINSEEIEMRFLPDPRVSLTVKAVSALTAAFRLLPLEQCGQRQAATSCLRGYRGTSDLHRRILANLRQLSFSSSAVTAEADPGQDDKVSRRQQLHRFAANGRLVANKLLVQKIVAGDGMKLVRQRTKTDVKISSKVFETLRNFRFPFLFPAG